MNSRHLTRIEAKENGDKNEKSLYKLMSTAMYGKIMEKFRSRTNVRLVNNKKKDYLKWTSKLSFDNDLVENYKSKVTLLFNKPAYVSMFIFDLTKVLMYEFHYNYINKI